MALFAKPAQKYQVADSQGDGEDEQASAAPARKIRGKLPEKRTINLATVNETHINWLLAIPLILLIFVAAGAFSKFFVIDRMAEANRVQSEVLSLRDQLGAVDRQLAEYDGVKDAYAHYTTSGMTKEELERVNRVDVMDMMERVAFPVLTVSSWSVSGNELTMAVKGEALETINMLVQAFLTEPLVDYCTVTDVVSEIREMPDAGEGTEEENEKLPELVDGNIVAVLRIPPKETTQ